MKKPSESHVQTISWTTCPGLTTLTWEERVAIHGVVQNGTNQIAALLITTFLMWAFLLLNGKQTE